MSLQVSKMCSSFLCEGRSPEEKLAMNATIKALEATQSSVPRPDLTGTHWRLVATNSASSSGGKLGPFIGPVEQVWTMQSS